MNTRYAIKHNTNGLYVHALAIGTNPSATENEADAKTWSNSEVAQRNIAKYNLTNVSVVKVAR